MFLESIVVVETSPCLAEEGLFKAVNKASVDLTELLPYINSVVDNPNYQQHSSSLVFKIGIVGFTFKKDEINITRFANTTELYELLDWAKDLINDTYESKAEIVPNYESRKIVPALKIYGMLPKTNCGKCGESACMAFAAKLNKLDAEIDDCPILQEQEYTELKEKLLRALQ